ncbi:GGDEF domain-containing protein [Paenibacillus methanolicus]|uniref:Diguanylate cyclase (GGDEF)-like protein n=1 Tax=Paenibacillus methanolicus TaxID=582686 RepID=A0A5S5C8X8_9BACL|nr:GGDEF domain-containing protein [Paenibacillus methanolicus]TYP74780.1 diguanylate cyclase (GGDEF)-like protein [Paenibacillus methanolicus]
MNARSRPNALVLFIVFLCFQFFEMIRTGGNSDLLYVMNIVAPALAIAVMIPVLKRVQGASRRFWRLIVITLVLEMLAQSIWAASDWIWQMPKPELSAADVLWLLQSGLLVAAMAQLVRGGKERFRLVTDSLSLLVSLLVVSWEFVIRPAYANAWTEGIDLSVAVNMLYPIADALMLFILFIWVLNSDRQYSRSARVYIVLAFLLYIAGDTAYWLFVDIRELDIEGYLDACWSVGAFALAMACKHEAADTRNAAWNEPTQHNRVVQMIKFGMPYLGLLIVTFIILIDRMNPFIQYALLFIVVLIIFRQVLFFAERERLHERLQSTLAMTEFVARHDGLTGLLNRKSFLEKLEASINEAARSEEQVAVCYFDLDRFKPVNDQYGHRAGDLLLQAVADRLRGLQEENVTFARLGGDEFALVMEKATRERVGRLAVAIAARLSEPYRMEELELHVSSSIGVALYPDHAVLPAELIQLADAAMYMAKREGGCRAVFAPAHEGG